MLPLTTCAFFSIFISSALARINAFQFGGANRREKTLPSTTNLANMNTVVSKNCIVRETVRLVLHLVCVRVCD